MIANINWTNPDNYKGISSCRKEKNFTRQYTLVDRASCTEYAEMRFYSTDARSYACLWVYGREKGCVAGGGWAGGYGYNRGSAAAYAAIKAAGITLDEPISGRGWGAVCEALEAVGRACGIDPVIFEAHP